MPTPPDPEQPPPGPVLEPVRVVRLRRFDALAELMREIRPDPVTHEDDTRELPPVPAPVPPPSGTPGPSAGPRRATVAAAVVAAALVGFGCALLLTGRQMTAATAGPAPPVTTAPPATAPGGPSAPTTSAGPTAPATAPDPDGPGTLRRGDTGPDVADLQQRLLRVPDVYRDGSTSGTYDTTLTEAVARFQLWYGVSGDERGVYGNDTRRALESRTGVGDDS
ncbi:hypothetical protein GCM10010300_83120 [Streptomyces olivaceoviridis]|uniref:peptidoglycan-binding protein n=1 Tax=Streptomyces olivaceoviridis TaxID=1921 RepID=UPI0016754C56|nr:peptidoglycan-binding protein [Streptomyces olivaceoviridis]GGZ27191.1 hypothetical protein GCM10010300_83120 [Streptomyces olivaceoviridis]